MDSLPPFTGYCREENTLRLAMLLFAGVRERLETADIPEFLKGLPITLIAAALVSLSFLGFAGIGG